eukprot:TRINITY_DN15488_c0_g2_i1.p2 TRINITY_DN15488_c0_g2~~TRINITY_DN15488_c0_g2_i1.p2  ORF type:complete len:108 (-),score=1.05 TRINITY_DN15488_c0_g2_i1:163-486(-)
MQGKLTSPMYMPKETMPHFCVIRFGIRYVSGVLRPFLEVKMRHVELPKPIVRLMSGKFGNPPVRIARTTCALAECKPVIALPINEAAGSPALVLRSTSNLCSMAPDA